MGRVLTLLIAGMACGLGAMPANAQPVFNGVDAPPDLNGTSHRYGSGQGQTIVVAVLRSGRPAPLVVLLTGADFAGDADMVSLSWVPAMLFETGFAVANVSTRPRHQAGIEGMLDDMVVAIGEIARRAGALGIDPDRIILMGGGSGGHAAALLGTDPSYFRRAGVPFAAIRGVVAVNGDGFDLVRRVATASRFRASRYRTEFGNDPARWRLFSPASHIAAPNASRFLFLASSAGGEFVPQARDMTSLLGSGAAAEFWTVPQTRRGAPGTYLGLPQHPRTRDLRSAMREMVGLPPLR